METKLSAAPPPSITKKTLLYPPFALGMCVRMVYTLKTNRHPIATAREMDVGLDEVGDGGRRDGMERRGERGRIRVHMEEKKRGGGKEGEKREGRGWRRARE